MPRPGPRRPIVALRLDDPTIERLDTLATRLGITRSELIEDALPRREAASLTPRP